MRLLELFLEKKFNTDKYDLGYVDGIYNDLFDPFKKNPISFLEIGIFNGESLRLWKEYFPPESKIYGMDINYCNNLSLEKEIKQIICDAYQKQSADIFKDQELDIIVDDGPHTIESFLKLIDLYYDKLKNGGLLVIEDIIRLEWTPILKQAALDKGYKEIIEYNMGGKQKTPHLYNLWKDGLDVLLLVK